jgi:CHAT domain-containing protein
VLLLGSPSPDLPDVPRELRAVEQCFVARYNQSGWPQELVKTVAPDDATPEHVELLLVGGDHDVLHIACHAGLEGDTPVLLLRDPASGNPLALPASAFGQWLKKSTLRFVYLSCCEGAAHPLTAKDVAGWSQSLCKEVLEAGVPEVVSYVWPVSDAGSVWFTREFYERFVHDFDAAAAVHQARRASPRDDPLWATAVLVQQTQADTA